MLLSTMYPIMYLPPSKVIFHQLAIGVSDLFNFKCIAKETFVIPSYRVGVKLMADLHEMLYFKHNDVVRRC